MLTPIQVYGHLASQLSRRVLHADISTAAEAVRFLVTNFPFLEDHMRTQQYKVYVGDYSLSYEELHHPIGNQHLRIIPVIGGAGSTVGRILLGVGLIAASFLLPGAGIFGATSIFGITAAQGGVVLASVGTILSGVGATLVLGGVSQLLSPVPTNTLGQRETQDPRKSFSFSGIQNTARQGTPVPVVYGETVVGSVVISVGIDTVQTVVDTDPSGMGKG